MAEIIYSNLIMGTILFFGFYPVYRKLCNGFWDYAKVAAGTFTVYYIFYFGAVMGFMIEVPSNHLWYPYSFGGMPAYGIGFIGVKWWNHIDLMIGAFIRTLYTNPLFTILFYLSIFWFALRYKKGKKILVNYILIIVAEMTMIFLTEWK